MKIGDKVKVLSGASVWLKKQDFWIKDWPESIDEMEGVIINDYSFLKGNDCHYEVDIEGVYGCGIHPQWLILSKGVE